MDRTSSTLIRPILLALLLPVGCGEEAPPPPLDGFTVEGSARERDIEAGVLGGPSAERMLAHHRVLTAEPHHAGTPANEATAEYFADRLREFGFDSIHLSRYEVLLPRPLERRVELLAPEAYVLRLEEPPLEPDPDTRKEGVLPPFNAFSPDGDVTAEVVYVNYGIPEDYRVLDSLGISVRGRIVIARYGRSWRGIKPRLAAERGAVGALIYSDPADDGFTRGPVMPDGKWRPEHGVQRGSVMDMPTHPGDPQTPGRPSLAGAERLPLEETTTLQRIPVQPISHADAAPILRNLSGPPAPGTWQGGLDFPYHLGPGPSRVRIRLRFDWSVRPIVNVVGVLRGTEEPEKVVMAGGHRDAWTFGGRDPISGTVSLLESARLIGEAALRGNRPRRSVAIASWDAEEYGLIGSTEYGEELGELLAGNVVVYLNRESYTAGEFQAAGSHALQPLMNAVAGQVPMPGTGASVHEAWLEAALAQDPPGTVEVGGRTDVRLGALGSGSDYTVFLDHLGIPSMDIRFTSENGIYHSRYDTHWYYTNYGDPGFAHGERLAEIVAIFMLRLANAEILPFHYGATAETVDRYLDEILEEARARGLEERLELNGARVQNGDLARVAGDFEQERLRVLALPPQVLGRYRDPLRAMNQALLDAERGFLHPEGLPGRPWYRHQLYAPGFYTGYGVKTLPGIREAVENGDPDEANRMAAALEAGLRRASSQLATAVLLARGIEPDMQAIERALGRVP